MAARAAFGEGQARGGTQGRAQAAGSRRSVPSGLSKLRVCYQIGLFINIIIRGGEGLLYGTTRRQTDGVSEEESAFSRQRVGTHRKEKRKKKKGSCQLL